MTLQPELKRVSSERTDDVPVAGQYSSFAPFGRAVSGFLNQSDLILALLLIIAASNFRYVLSSPAVVPSLNFLDHSWAIDFIAKTKQHVWLGDSVAFSYGPLSQLVSSAFAIPLGGSLGAYFRSSHLMHLWAGIAFTFLTGRLLLGGHAPWKRSFYLLGMVGFWNALEMRFCYDLLIFAVSLVYFDGMRGQRVSAWKSLFISLLLVLGFMISADTGFYSVAAFLIAGSAHLLMFRSDRRTLGTLLRSIAVCALTFGALAALSAALMPHARFGFWANSIAVVSEYRWSMAYSMEKAVKWRLVAAFATCTLVLLAGYKWRHPVATSLARRPVFFPAAIAFSFVAVQSAVVRSDWGHVSIALLPAIGLAGTVLMGAEQQKPWNWRGDFPVVLALGLTAVFSGPVAQLSPRNILDGLRLAAITRGQSCPVGMWYLDGACLQRSDYEPLKTVSEYLRQNTSAAETVAIFPFENVYGAVAQRRVAGGMLQNYQVAGERLTRLQVDGLERDQPRVTIFSADGLATFAVDEVPNFIRTPDVWFYLQSRFIKVAELRPGVAVLRREQSRNQRLHQEATVMGSAFQFGIRLKQPIAIPLNNWPREADFLKLQIRVDYPILWRLTKPSILTVTVRHSDTSEKVFRAVLPPNKSTNLWIYPWDEFQLINYFDKDEEKWRVGRPRAPVQQIAFRFERMDWLSAIPTQINIQAIEAVRLRLQ